MKLLLKIIAWCGKYIGFLFSHQPDNGDFKRILVFQAGGIGDIIRVFPVITALRERFPDAYIASLSPFPETVYQLLPEQYRPNPRFAYEPLKQHKGLSAKLRLMHSLRKQRFDLIINPARGEGMLENAILAWVCGAPCRAGFERAGAGFLNTVKVELQDRIAIVRQNLDLLNALGIAEQTPVGLEIAAADRDFARQLLASLRQNPEQAIVVVQAGNHWRPELRWPQQRYAQLLQTLSRQRPCLFLLLGTTAETALNRWVISEAALDNVVDLSGQTTLTQLAAVMTAADLFIGNDSGPLHLALAVGVPCIGLFGYTLPAQVICTSDNCIALHKASAEQVFLHQPFQEFDRTTRNPIENIDVDEVAAAAVGLLNGDSKPASAHG
ncbi:glycosyltransferase family 9 protein [Methylomonas sp. HYX-M1]|uniref:glycosyltransferase family 9 protein n=1 Tax=Methylomonas sp. HYX-M1 TaxID=3139307 RepID=UPI00345C4B70